MQLGCSSRSHTLPAVHANYEACVGFMRHACVGSMRHACKHYNECFHIIMNMLCLTPDCLANSAMLCSYIPCSSYSYMLWLYMM